MRALASNRSQMTLLKPQGTSQRWVVVDAAGLSLGRLAADIAVLLMGKHRPDYTPHVACGDKVIVINADKVVLTGNKGDHKFVQRYSEYPGGLKRVPYSQVIKTNPGLLIELATRRMLPKSRLGRVMLSNLFCYTGDKHPHASNQPVAVKL